MGPPVLPAYSLRVQLFSPLSYSSDDKPQRNFRVVASPEMTVREFCMEASRIHEINYGYPLAIKKVQDDQAFDVTQSEILGNLFSASSIIRVVQASKHPGIRDSIPPTSALRFNPAVTQKKRRHCDDGMTETVSSRKPNKRQRFFEIDPDNPLPSRESDTTPPPGYLSHAQVVNVMKRFGIPSKQISRKSTLQVSETPEHLTSLEFQKPKIPEKLSTLVLPNLPSTPDSRSENVGLGNLSANNFCRVESLRSSADNARQQTDSEDSGKFSSSPSTRRSISLGQNHAQVNLMSLQRPQEMSSVSETRSVNELCSSNLQISSAENIISDEPSNVHQVFKKSVLMSQQSPSVSGDSENSEKKNCNSPVMHKLKTEDQIEPRNYGLDHHSNSSELSEIYSEEESKSKQSHPTQGRILQGQKICEEEDPLATTAKTEKSPNMKKNCRKDSTRNRNSTQKTLSMDVSSMQKNEVQQERVVDENNGSSILKNGEKIQYKEGQTAENGYEKNHAVSEGKVELQKPAFSVEKSWEDLKYDSTRTPNLNQSKYASPASLKLSKDSKPSSIVPPRNGKVNPVLKSSQAETSSPLQSSNLEITPTHDHVDNSNSSLTVRKVSFIENVKKVTSTKLPSRNLPNISAPSESKGSVQKNSQKKSFTPILPPKKLLNPSVHVTARDSCKTLTSESKVTPTTKFLPPTKVTPVLPPKKPLAVISNSKQRNSPISTSVSNDARLAKSPSKILNQKKSFLPETRKSAGDINDFSCAVSKNTRSPPNHQKIHYTTTHDNYPQSMELESSLNEKSELDDRADDMNRDGTESQNSTERDSRSPVAFYHNSQLPKTQQTSATSSTDSQSEDEDSPESDSDEDHKNTNQELFKLNSDFRPESNSGIRFSPKRRIIIPGSKEDISKVQVPNSSPPTNLGTSPSRLTKSNTAQNSYQKAHSSPSSTAVYGSIKVPSSSDTRKPQFGFGASLSAIHRSGGLVGMPNPNLKPNGHKIFAPQLETNSGSENSDTESSSSDDEHQNETELIGRPSISVPKNDSNPSVESKFDSDSESNSDSDDSDVKGKLTEQEAKNELFAKINDLTKNSYNLKVADVGKKNTQTRSDIRSSQTILPPQFSSDSKAAETAKRSSNAANKYTQGYVFSQPTL
ncbi:hypothetical protein GcM3_205004 [Golovinomyces cichoracearum]|uniref:Uncharacterized protein n=1 Tax=Golovinomyces cichoracearum TaxID=62708 RepID=A0A420HC53_9PEZI|nr:hypothetical protein GcM3_205004 [Golovinomyces cichoracearum]